MSNSASSLTKDVKIFCKKNRRLFFSEHNLDFNRIFFHSFLGAGFCLILIFVEISNYINTKIPWLLFSHVPALIGYFLYYLIVKKYNSIKYKSIAYFDFLLFIVLIDVYFMIGPLIEHTPTFIVDGNFHTSNILIFLAISFSPNMYYKIPRDCLFIVANITTYYVYDPNLILNSADSLVINGLVGFTFSFLIIFGAKYKFYFSQINFLSKKHAYEELSKLLYGHQIKLIDHGEILQNTMPIETTEACVVNFDIVDSTKIGHSTHHEFFVSVLKKCYRLMNQDYDPAKMSAKAYMIKEVGDGFICSINFPFKCNHNPFETATRLANEFVSVFKQEVTKEFGQNTIYYCGIGIGHGRITGYFPKIGLKYYDVLGDGIVKATRYQSMRKILQEKKEVPIGNIIILQDFIFKNLPEKSKNQFIKYDLLDYRVRDDEEAKHLYYKIIG